MFRDLFEPLESRRLMSVTAADLVGPLVPGSTFTYETVVGNKIGGKHTETVIGATKFNGSVCTEVQSITVSGTTTATTDVYESVNSTQGFDVYGQSVTTKTPTETTTTTRTYSPAQNRAPATIVAGKVYTFSFTDTILTTTTIGGKTTKTSHTETLVDTIKLVSNTPAVLSPAVPAGKFSAYEIEITSNDKSAGVVTKTTGAIWFVPGIGVVKEISYQANGTTDELVSYKIK